MNMSKCEIFCCCTQICRRHLRGTCRKGLKCKYLHVCRNLIHEQEFATLLAPLASGEGSTQKESEGSLDFAQAAAMLQEVAYGLATRQNTDDGSATPPH